MRVLFIAQGLDRPESHLLVNLHRAGLDLEVMVRPEDDFHAMAAGAGISTHPYHLEQRIDRKAIRFIRDLVTRGSFTIVHALRNNHPLANAVWALKGLPTHLVCYRGTMGNLHRWDPGSRLSYLHPRVDRIVCVSNAVRDYLLTLKIPEEHLVTIYKGHDPDWYRGHQTPDMTPFDIPGGAFVVGCAANMRPLKGVDVLIRSLEHVEPGPDVHLLLAGEVRDPVITQLCENEPFRSRVHLAGYREDAPALMGTTHAFAMPSLRREGLPRAVIETMSQGIPTIVTNVGGMPELVKHGQTGLVVPPGNPEELGKAITFLASDEALRKSFGQQALERIQGPFGSGQYAEQTRALYESLG